jgi:hypothetical protein
MESLIRQFVDWHTSILNGEEVDVASIEGLLETARDAAPRSDSADVERLLQAVDALELLIRERYQEIGEELRRLGQGRQALRGYNHIRGHSEGQRLYRRA